MNYFSFIEVHRLLSFYLITIPNAGLRVANKELLELKSFIVYYLIKPVFGIPTANTEQ